MGKVEPFTGITTQPEDSDGFLDKVKTWGCDRLVVVGFTPDNEFMFGFNFSDSGQILLLLEYGKKDLLED